jgi:hypothetical protein
MDAYDELVVNKTASGPSILQSPPRNDTTAAQPMPMHACSSGELTAEDLIEALDGVPPDQLHYPAIKIAALRDALSHWERGEVF